jgi:hypothetical protein
LIPSGTAIDQRYCGGFVLHAGAAASMAAGHVAAMANMPLFLQLVGTGLTTALCLHLGSVLVAARWPAITCYELYEHPLIRQRHDVRGGLAPVPTGPGLGVEIDMDAVERYRVDVADISLPRRLIRHRRVAGLSTYHRAPMRYDSTFMGHFLAGNEPVFERGVSLELVDDDGSSEFDALYQGTAQVPVVVDDRDG